MIIPESGTHLFKSAALNRFVLDKASEVVHNIKHYGAFGEDYLGYSDPTKDLRKAVKQVNAGDDKISV